jgi:hypothetical protein
VLLRTQAGRSSETRAHEVQKQRETSETSEEYRQPASQILSLDRLLPNEGAVAASIENDRGAAAAPPRDGAGQRGVTQHGQRQTFR